MLEIVSILADLTCSLLETLFVLKSESTNLPYIILVVGNMVVGAALLLMAHHRLKKLRLGVRGIQKHQLELAQAKQGAIRSSFSPFYLFYLS